MKRKPLRQKKGVVRMTDNKIIFNPKNSINKYETKAYEIIDGRRDNNVLSKALELAEKIPVIKDLARDIPVMVNMVKDYIGGYYKRVPKKTIVALTASLIYLVTPCDIIPDWISGGYIDDAAVVSYVLNSVKYDV